jgi:N-acetylglutamate synthase-like GNAT family acetyltransferase
MAQQGVDLVESEIQIRRAKRADIARIVVLARKATRSRLQVDEATVMEWLFGKGLWVATHGDELVGVVAYQTENLVAVTDVFYVSPAQWREVAGAKLLATVEAEAGTLMCEANVLLLPAWTSKAVRAFLHEQGYESHGFEGLHRIWREVLADFVVEGMYLGVKRLRDRMVMVPL